MVGIALSETDWANKVVWIMFVLLPSSIPGLLLAVFCFKAWRKALNHSIAVTPDKLSINDFKSYSISWSEITALSIDEINYFRAGRQISLKIHVLDETAYLKNSCFHRWESRLTGGGLAVRINNYEEKPPACLLYTSPSPRDRTRSRMPSSA